MSSVESGTSHTLYIVGAGGHGREIAWLATEIWSHAVDIRFIVNQEEYLTGPVNGIGVELLDRINVDGSASYVVAIGEPKLRSRLDSEMRRTGLAAHTLVHPNTLMSARVDLGAGVVIAAGCVLTTNVSLAKHVHVNVGCSISHDVFIGAYSTLSPGVRVSGHVHIGNRVFIGIGANIINGSADDPLVIGDDAIIAAGSCVTGHVTAGALVAGVPALRKR